MGPRRSVSTVSQGAFCELEASFARYDKQRPLDEVGSSPISGSSRGNISRSSDFER